MAIEWINTENLFISATIEADGSVSVTVGARYESAPVIILADGPDGVQALADLLRATADKINPCGQDISRCPNPWHHSAPIRAQIICSECPSL